MIIIIGDSFCSDYAFEYWQRAKRQDQNFIAEYQTGRDQNSWVTNVIEHFGGNVDVFGFGGRSWWYSWFNFYKEWKDRLNEISAVGFVILV